MPLRKERVREGDAERKKEEARKGRTRSWSAGGREKGG